MRIWREEGFVGFMRGNGINCLRIVPYSAVQFTTYEQLKKVRFPLVMIGLVWLQFRIQSRPFLSLSPALHQQRQKDIRHTYTAGSRCFGRNNLSLSVRSFYSFFISSITLFSYCFLEL